jgi:hypothetical protein
MRITGGHSSGHLARLAVVAIVAISMAWTALAQTYSVTDLGTLGGTKQFRGCD